MFFSIINSQAQVSLGASDDPIGRAGYEHRMLSAPDGKIPAHARERELTFSLLLPIQESGRSAALQFKKRGPWNVGGMTRALAMDITDTAILFAGTNSGGLWRSFNGGQTWNLVTPKDSYHGVTCIAQDTRQGHTQTWYFGSGDPWCSASGRNAFYSGDGIYKSTDGGFTWSKLTSTAPNTPQAFDSEWDVIYRVITNPADTVNDIVYAACYGAIFKSMDGGATWSVARGSTSGTQSFFSNIECSTTGVLYATLSSDGNGKGIWRSPDGMNWTRIDPPSFPQTYERIVSGISPSDENTVYFLGNTPGFGIPDTNFVGDVEWNSLWRYTYLSGNGDSAGCIWEDLSLSLPSSGGPFDKFNCQGSYDLVIKVKPDDPQVVFIGGTNLYRSLNGFQSDSTNSHIGGYKIGTAFPIIEEYEVHHPDQHDLLFYPNAPSKMLSACDGGVYKTDNNLADTVSWISLNDGYVTGMFYTLAMDHATPGNPVIVGGLQDNGTWFTNSEDSLQPWTHPRGGDGSYCYIADGRSMYYFSIQNGKMMKAQCDNDGHVLSYARIDPIGGERYQFINPFAIDPADNNRLYLAGGKYLWKNTDLASIPLINNWDSISTNWVQWPDSVPLANATISAVAVSKSNPVNRVYYGTSRQRIYRIDDAHIGTPAATSVTVTSGAGAMPSSGYVSCLAIDPHNANKVMAVFSNYAVYSLYYSEDAGATWSKVAGNLEQTTSGSGNGPSLRWATIVHPPSGGTVYFLGTSIGLYATSKLNGLNTIWTQMAPDEIGKVVVTMMDYRESDGTLIIATHAHGVYSTIITDTTQVPSGLMPLEDQTDIDIYPNPSKDGVVQIQTLKEIKSVVVYDELGRLVQTISVKRQSGNRVQLIHKDSVAGYYIAEVIFTDNSMARKMYILAR